MDLDRWDVIGAAGILAIVVGLWLLEPWISLTAGGALLLVVAIAGSFDSLYAEARAARERRNREGS